MNTPIRIEAFQISEHEYCVIVGDLIAQCLNRDETLGVIAAAIYNPAKMPPYLRPIASRAIHYGEGR